MHRARASASAVPAENLDNRMIVMGRVGAPFGIKGWVKVHPFTRTVEGLLEHEVWWLGRDGHWDRVEIEDGAAHGRGVIAKLKGSEDRQAAIRLRGLEVAVPRHALPANEDGEYYWSDLIGLAVETREGLSLGRVARLIETGASSVLVVEGERERLIPFTEPVVVFVAMADRRLIVDWGEDF